MFDVLARVAANYARRSLTLGSRVKSIVINTKSILTQMFLSHCSQQRQHRRGNGNPRNANRIRRQHNHKQKVLERKMRQHCKSRCHIMDGGRATELEGVFGYTTGSEVICEHFPDEYFSVNQYENLDNMMAHYETTAQEIWDQSEGKVTHFVMAASTGGTIMGVGTYLKERNDGINVVLADPHKSNLAGILEKSRGNVSKGESMLKRAKQYTKEEGGGIQVEGAGKASLTTIMKRDGEVLKPVDEAVVVHDFDAFNACRKLDREKGVRVGGSAGLNIVACRRLAERMIDEGRKEGATLVTLLCDDGNKYASKIFDDDWVEANDHRPKRFQQRRVPSGGAQTTALEDGR